jgi:hypothetical protein
MKSIALLVVLCAACASARAQGYYINPNVYTNMYAVSGAQLAQNLQFAARIRSLKDQQAVFESIENRARRNAPAPFTATDFRPTGPRDAPQRLAAQVKDVSLRPQITKLARDIVAVIEQQPDFRRNNLAYAFTIYLGGSLQVLSGREFDDAQSAALAKWINDEMVAAGAVAKLDAAQRTQLYDVLLLQGGLIIGIAQAGAENGDSAQVELAKKMARDALATFGLDL